MLLGHQGDLTADDLMTYAGDLGLDVPRFENHLSTRTGAVRHRRRRRLRRPVRRSRYRPRSSSTAGAITGAYDVQSLTGAIKAAKARAAISA